MICRDLLARIEASFPKEAAMGFDNVGLLSGRYEKEVNKVFISLDVSIGAIDEAIKWGADLLITHHPIIMGNSIDSVTNDNYIGKRLIKLIQNDISYYAMHTNHDALSLSDLMSDLMGLVDCEILCPNESTDCLLTLGESIGIGRIGRLTSNVSLRECCEVVKDKFNLKEVRVFGDLEKEVYKIAVSPGSGRSAVGPAIRAGADVLIAGDILHHDGLEAKDSGLAIIDAGHYGTEHIFIADMESFLIGLDLDLEIKTMEIEHPFEIV